MKKLILFALSIVLFTTTLFWAACSKTEDEGWTDDEKASYEEVISLQDEVSNNLDEWFLSMDSLDAINMAYQSFTDAPSVSEATINRQGIVIQYANGMKGGLFLKGKLFDYKKSASTNHENGDPNAVSNLKSIVNGRKVLQMDAAYSQFAYYTDQVHNINSQNLSKVGMSITDYLKDSEVTVDRLTQLTGYGIVDMSGHGLAWPKQSNITDIYYMTGETVSENTSKKYWDELKTGNIPVMKTLSRGIIPVYNHNPNLYFVSPDFISNYNDFSKDTVLFYGGFCYSFLGGWPDIIDGFGDGAYLGFDWHVQGFHCANWDINSIALMSDTSKAEPMNLEEWMNDGSIDKSYNEGGRTISIHYTGDGNLTLWGDVSVNLIALSDDGTPVSKPGEAGVAYPFRCDVVSNITELEYSWDIGNGGTPVTASNSVNITWSEDGDYILKVDVKDKSNGNIIGSATANVTIGSNQDVKEYVLSCNTVGYYFGTGSGGSELTIWDDFSLYGENWSSIINFDKELVWNGLNFSATIINNDEVFGNYSYTKTITGTLSSDGQLVSFVAEQEGWKNYGEKFYHYFKLTVDNAPLFHYSPPSNTSNGHADYGDEDGQNAQTYVTAFEGRIWNDSGTTNNTVIGINWDKVNQISIYFGTID